MAKKTLDPATQYAADVRDGKAVVSRLVRLACLRHLRDLEEQDRRGLQWCPEKAQDVIDFFAEVLCLPEDSDSDDETDNDEPDVEPEAGTPFVLTPFQQFIVGSLFGWYANRVSKQGHRRLVRRFRIAFIETAKGSGKTPLCAGMLIYMLVAEPERGAQLFCAAVTKEQARIAFTDCEKMIVASPHLKAMIDQKVNNLAVLETGSFIRPISSEKRGLDGKRVNGAVIEELHEHPTGTVVQKVLAGIKGRRNALIFLPTNSGYDRQSICWHYHEYSRQVLDGTLENDAWFAFVCHLDPCVACTAAGKQQPSDDCPNCDDWKVEGAHWLKANPNLGVSLPWQYLREQVRQAIDVPSDRNMVRRLNFCQWTQQGDLWIPTELWTACEGELPESVLAASLVGRDCYLGIDLSEKIDLSSVVLIFPRAIPRSQGSEAMGNDDDGPVVPLRPSINRAIDVLSYFWMPEATIHRRAEEDRVEYPRWARDGFVFPTPGSMVDQDAILAFIIDTIKAKYRVRGIGVDMAGAAAVVTRLQREFGDDFVIEIPQGFRHMNEPSKELEALIVSGHLTHGGNQLMGWCISNMAKEENHWREIRPVKVDQRKRIDGGVALIDAIAVEKILAGREPVAPVGPPRVSVISW